MRFLVDKNLSHRICGLLGAAGHEAVHVDDLSMASADDVDILERARSDDAVIVSSDTDAEVIVVNLPAVADALEEGAVVAVGRSALRVRRLPLR